MADTPDFAAMNAEFIRRLITDEEARDEALVRYLHDQACYRDDNEAAFQAGWDAARTHEGPSGQAVLESLFEGGKAMGTSDDREALDQCLRDANGYWPQARENILAAGFRRPGPITETLVDDVALEMHRWPKWPGGYGWTTYRGQARAVLESLFNGEEE